MAVLTRDFASEHPDQLALADDHGEMTWSELDHRIVALMLRSAGGQAIWPTLQIFFDPAFVDEIERVVAGQDSTWLETLLPRSG